MRLFLFAAVTVILYTPALAVDGVNMPGSDYANFNADSWFVCRNTCGGEGECAGWAWVKPGIQGANGHCWLKSKVSPLVKDDCCHAGLHEQISARDLKAEPNTNRPGSDYKNFETNRWSECETACSRENTCVSWSHVPPGVQGKLGRCWLKRQVARPVNGANMVSGVKYRDQFKTF
jgi:hypothetical protein